MLNNREISELFEVQVNTLYNWQKSKPKLYKYLRNADYNSIRNEEINVLLQEYAKNMKMDFTIDELSYILKSDLELVTIDEINSFAKSFIKSQTKNMTHSIDIILSIYDKLKSMNIIEKYILYKKIYLYKDDKTNNTIEEFFQEFLK